jgi:hypothetical protein
MRLAVKSPDPVVTDLAWPETGLFTSAGSVSDCKGLIIKLEYMKLLFCTSLTYGIFPMNYSNITQAYQNAERQALEETNDPHLIIMTLLDALVKSMQIFVDNIDPKTDGNMDTKSKHFSRAISIIYPFNRALTLKKVVISPIIFSNFTNLGA